VLAVLAELYGLQPRLGYYLLYYLKSYNKLDSKSKSLIYKEKAPHMLVPTKPFD
jgi:hypothetical protein